MQIGGRKRNCNAATQPQFVVQAAKHINEYLLFKHDAAGDLSLIWIGDANAATKFNSKFSAKARVRELADVPTTRCFKKLEG